MKIKSFLPYDHQVEVKSLKSLITVRKHLFHTSVVINPVFIKADDNTVIDIINFIKNVNQSEIEKIKERLASFYEKNKHIRTYKIIHNSSNKQLVAVFTSVINRINSLYPEIDMSNVKITWGRKIKNRSRIIRFGSFDMNKKIIRIHPILDEQIIPDFFFRSIVYHEAAHYIHNQIHKKSRSFHDKNYYMILKKIDENFELSLDWEKKNKHIFFQ
jgi:predicted SprT family Zn-dependent metalloprotease